MVMPPTGLSGPVTLVKTCLSDCSSDVILPRGAGLVHTDWFSLKITDVGFADDCGKCLVSSVWPLAESYPAGALVLPPKPAAE